MNVTVALNQAVNFTPKQFAKLQMAVNCMQDRINTQTFRDKVLNHKYLGKFQYANNGGLTNEEVYNLLMSGKEVLTPTEDNEIDLQVTLYTKWFSNTIGYTYPNTPMQWINKKYFDKWDYNAISQNLLHEYCHKLGFDHDFKPTIARPYSVPYGVAKFI